ncbi:coiled-coil domain-containing protein [Paenibacillus sacheonensis]|uniref:Uncharacterized protein n=1 Tax=Paenibacillus sacheonensis TaxID=742054 RepID=A0A7X4YVJ2_9BACL|nr:hypothetical protein [Paenibacillus sacheonensis]MBM7565688.1 hypothetical protein [Paenibacillus sacheonensis]NBC72254.1 hypothetical protein [Paenibacillus sacheonensis]
MQGTKRRWIAALTAGAIASWLAIYPVLAEPAVPQDEEIRSVLEKSLSVVEIDKEISRIQAEQSGVKAKLSSAQAELDMQQAAIDKKREDAGKVLRAYYTGERDVLLTAVLSARNLSALLTVMDYFDYIFSSDKTTLNDYTKQYKAIKKSIASLNAQSAQLDEVEARLQTQRSRVTALQNDVDAALSGRSDADKLRSLIDEYTDYWQNVGLVEVNRYFKALSKAMGHITAWVEKNKDMLDIDGFNYTLTIPDDKLNAFLREQNEIFDNFAFAFEPDKVIITGKRDDLEVELLGHYTLEKNGAIQFHVDELIFNGLALPDTTRKQLERQFDLGFDPAQIVSFLKAKSVAVENGTLVIKLSISL